MKKLQEALENATNVKQIIYNKDSGMWTVIFYKGKPNIIDPKQLIEFLTYA